MTGITVKQLKDKDGNCIQPNSPDCMKYINFTSPITSYVVGTEYEAPNDGWVKFNGTVDKDATHTSTKIGLYIDGIQVQSVAGYDVKLTSTVGSAIAKGQKFKIEILGTLETSPNLNFFNAINGGGV